MILDDLQKFGELTKTYNGWVFVSAVHPPVPLSLMRPTFRLGEIRRKKPEICRRMVPCDTYLRNSHVRGNFSSRRGSAEFQLFQKSVVKQRVVEKIQKKFQIYPTLIEREIDFKVDTL